MKRFLFLFCTALLCCTLIAVPALAAESISSNPPDYSLAEPLPEGEYTLTITWADSTIISEPFFVEYVTSGPSDGYQEFFSANEISFDNFDHIVSVSVEYDALNGDIQDVWITSNVDGYGTEYFRDLNAVFTFNPIAPKPSPTGILEVFTSIGSWLGSALGTLSGVFWSSASNSLTFLGVLAVAGLALAVVLLVIFVVVRFLRFRG